MMVDHVEAQRTDVQAPWYLAYTKPRLERMAVAHLERQGFEAYLAMYKKLGRGHRAADVAFEPMFPRYVFFRPVSARQSISVVRSTQGVSTLVRFGADCAKVAHETIESVRACEQMRNEAGLDEISPLRAGMTARLRCGALRGLEGLVSSVSSRRVVLLLELLGRQHAVAVEHHELAPA